MNDLVERLRQLDVGYSDEMAEDAFFRTVIEDAIAALTPVTYEEVQELVQFLHVQAHEHVEGISKMGFGGKPQDLKLWKAADLIERLARESRYHEVCAKDMARKNGADYAEVEELQQRIEELESEASDMSDLAADWESKYERAEQQRDEAFRKLRECRGCAISDPYDERCVDPEWLANKVLTITSEYEIDRIREMGDAGDGRRKEIDTRLRDGKLVNVRRIATGDE